MSYLNQFRTIMLTHHDVDDRIIRCNELTNKVVKERAIRFAEWLKYNDEVFEKFATNKISTNSLYGIFLDSLKP